MDNNTIQAFGGTGDPVQILGAPNGFRFAVFCGDFQPGTAQHFADLELDAVLIWQHSRPRNFEAFFSSIDALTAKFPKLATFKLLFTLRDSDGWPTVEAFCQDAGIEKSLRSIMGLPGRLFRVESRPAPKGPQLPRLTGWLTGSSRTVRYYRSSELRRLIEITECDDPDPASLLLEDLTSNPKHPDYGSEADFIKGLARFLTGPQFCDGDIAGNDLKRSIERISDHLCAGQREDRATGSDSTAEAVEDLVPRIQSLSFLSVGDKSARLGDPITRAGFVAVYIELMYFFVHRGRADLFKHALSAVVKLEPNGELEWTHGLDERDLSFLRRNCITLYIALQYTLACKLAILRLDELPDPFDSTGSLDRLSALHEEMNDMRSEDQLRERLHKLDLVKQKIMGTLTQLECYQGRVDPDDTAGERFSSACHFAELARQADIESSEFRHFNYGTNAFCTSLIRKLPNTASETWIRHITELLPRQIAMLEGEDPSDKHYPWYDFANAAQIVMTSHVTGMRELVDQPSDLRSRFSDICASAAPHAKKVYPCWLALAYADRGLARGSDFALQAWDDVKEKCITESTSNEPATIMSVVTLKAMMLATHGLAESQMLNCYQDLLRRVEMTHRVMVPASIKDPRRHSALDVAKAAYVLPY